MNVLLLTVFLSLLLAGVFLLCFIRDQRDREGGSEQDALRPFDSETPKSTLSK